MHLTRRAIARVLAIVIAVAAIGFFANRTLTSNDPGESKRTQPKLPSIGIGAKDFVDKFNVTSKSDPADFELGDPTWIHDDAIDLDVASFPVGDWSLIELYRDPQKRISAVYVVAKPTTEEQRSLFLNIGTSVIATVIHLDRTASESILEKDLKAEPAPASQLNEKIERFGLKFALTFKDGAYQLTVTNATASETPKK